MTTLTRQEAAARAALLDVERYDVRLDLTGLLDGARLRSSTTIEFGCRRAGAATFVDVVADELDSVRLNGSEVPDPVWDGERLELVCLAGRNVVEIVTSTERTDQRTGIHRAVDPGDGLAYVWTTFEPDDARRVFACFDQPDLKAVFGFTVLAPPAWTVVSNSPGRPTATAEGAEWAFDDTPRLSTYVSVVCAGPFHEVSREVDGHVLRLLARASLAARLDEQSDELFSLTAAGLAWFGDRFAMPFPQREYTQVFCPDYQGAMENYGCVVWTDVVVFRSTPTAEQAAERAVVLLHEMAHMWFGDIVTMRWWDDLWLNESFADWAAHWAAAGATAYTSAWADFVGLKETGYVADRAPTTHPVRQEVPDVEAAMASFDMITYAKGASVLRQLSALVGEDAFVAGLVQHFADHAWGNATVDDLLAAVSGSSGRDLTGWAGDWLRTAGTNTLALDVAASGDVYTSVAVAQSAPAGLPTLRRHRLDVGVYDLLGEPGDPDQRLRRRARLEVEADGPRTDLPGLAGTPVAQLLLPNDGDLDFARTPLDPASAATALAHGHTLADPVSRAVLRLVLWHEVDDGRMPASDAVHYALRAVAVEPDPGQVDALLTMAVDGSTWWTGTGREQLQAEVAQVCLDLAARPSVPPAARTGLLRAAAATAAVGQLDAVHRAAAGEVDVRWRHATRAASLGRYDAAGVQALLADDPDPDAASRAVAVRAARPEAAAKEEAWDAGVVSRTVPQTALREIGLAFWQPGQDALLAPFAERFLPALPVLSDAGMLSVMSLIGAFFPRAGVGADYPARAVEAARAAGVSPLASSRVRERADVLSRMLEARAG